MEWLPFVLIECLAIKFSWIVPIYPIYQIQFMKESELRRIQLSTPGAYRVTIPMRFVKELGMESGDYLRFTLSGKTLQLEKQ